MTVKFTPGGRRQFLDGLSFIARDNPIAARDFRTKAERTLARLTAFPDSGRRVPELPDLPYREVIISPYRFFYRPDGETIWLGAVWHSAQLPDAPE